MGKLVFKQATPDRHEVDGQVVLVRAITAGELAGLLDLQRDASRSRTADFELARLAVLCEDGTPAFETSAEVEALPPLVAAALIKAAVSKQGLGEVDEKKDA